MGNITLLILLMRKLRDETEKLSNLPRILWLISSGVRFEARKTGSRELLLRTVDKVIRK